MKKYIFLLSCLLIVTTVSLFMNCANEDQGGSNQGQGGGDFGFTPGAPTTDNSESGYGFDPTNPARGAYYSSSGRTESGRTDGTSAPITITDEAAFEDFRLGEPVNRMDDIEDLRIYVKLSKASSKYYAGDVTIAYWDSGRERPERKIEFESGSGDNAKYNVWFIKNSKEYFHGFFQEAHGSIVVVIDSITPVVPNPDNPAPNTLYNGSIWVMQFRTTFNRKNSCNNHEQKYIFEYNKTAPKPIPTLAERTRKCWFITSAAYDCRTWRKGNGVDTFKYIYPTSCYKKMGSFKGLDILKAFNISTKSGLHIHN